MLFSRNYFLLWAGCLKSINRIDYIKLGFNKMVVKEALRQNVHWRPARY